MNGLENLLTNLLTKLFREERGSQYNGIVAAAAAAAASITDPSDSLAGSQHIGCLNMVHCAHLVYTSVK